MSVTRPFRPVWAAVLFSLGVYAAGQGPAPRLRGPITGASQVVLAGSKDPRAQAGNDLGTLPANTPIGGMKLVFSRSAAQEAALQTLIAAQQNPASPQYHQWLTPDGFAARFGVADSDLATVESWLQSQGLTVNGVARSRDRITFSGTAAQVGTAFGTQLHRYRTGTGTHFAPSTELSLPAALAPVVSAVLDVSDFRLKPQIRLLPAQATKPDLTSAQTQSHFLTPKDVATMYDVNSVYNSGFTGTGQSIAIAGQSYIETADITNFQSAAGLPANPPTMVLVPNSGAAQISGGDEGESDLDLEYSTGMAPAAKVFFVYTGNQSNSGVLDAFDYAITEDIAPVVSLSYGGCEPLQTASYVQAQNLLFEQAAAQGQTLIASSGDTGSTECYGYTDASGNPVPQTETVAVNFPADSPYVTGMGGTQMAAGTYAAGDTQYWAAATGSDTISSLLSYVPEVTWNEDSAQYGLSASGGGASTLFTRPSWQTGVPGIPTGTQRLLPDISLQSSVDSPGYVFCTSDAVTLGEEGLTTSCVNGFRSAGTGAYLTVAGGTSFSAPIFSGLMAVLNQAKHSTGQGNVNPILYGLAGNATTYATAFHDIASGTNDCAAAGVNYCSGLGDTDYPAGVGYDEATGLGSLDFANLIAAWPNSTAATLVQTTMTASATPASPTAGAAESIAINVTAASGPAPTGTVTISVDGGTPVSVPLTAGAATYNFTYPATGGSHTYAITYAGDTTYAPSTTSVFLMVGSAVPGGSFTMTAGNISVPTNSVGTSALTVAPAGGYNGTVLFNVTSALPSTVCYEVDPLPVDGTTVGTVYFGEGTVCTETAAIPGAGGSQTRLLHGAQARLVAPDLPGRSELRGGAGAPGPWGGRPALISLAGLAFAGLLFRRRSRRLPALLAVGFCTLVLGLGLSGCGSTTGSSTPVKGPATTGTTYNVTLVGTDSITSAIVATTSFTVTVTP